MAPGDNLGGCGWPTEYGMIGEPRGVVDLGGRKEWELATEREWPWEWGW